MSAMLNHIKEGISLIFRLCEGPAPGRYAYVAQYFRHARAHRRWSATDKFALWFLLAIILLHINLLFLSTEDLKSY